MLQSSLKDFPEISFAMELSADDVERALLSSLAGSSSVESSALASSLGVDHARLVGVIKSLVSAEVVAAQALRLRGPAWNKKSDMFSSGCR